MKITSSGRFHSAERFSPWCGGIGLHLLRGLDGWLELSANSNSFIFYFIFVRFLECRRVRLIDDDMIGE